MQPLYALSASYQELLELSESAEDQQAFSDTLEGIAGDIREKLLNIAAVLKSLDSQVDAVKAEEDRLASRRRAMTAAMDRLKAYAAKAMIETGVTKAKNSLWTVWLQDNPPSVVLDEGLDVATLPEKYRRVKYEADKAVIKQDLTTGVELKFARIEKSKGMRVR